MFKQLTILGSLLYANAAAKRDPFYRGECVFEGDDITGFTGKILITEEGTT